MKDAANHTFGSLRIGWSLTPGKKTFMMYVRRFRFGIPADCRSAVRSVMSVCNSAKATAEKMCKSYHKYM